MAGMKPWPQIPILYVVLASSFAFVAPQLANAESAPEPDGEAQSAQARAHRALGQAALEEGDHAGALRELQQSFELEADSELRYDIGRCHSALGHSVEARQELQLYLAEVDPSQIPAERRQEVERMLAELEGQVAQLEIRVPVEGAAVTVDGRAVGRSPLLDPVTVEPGVHEVGCSAEGQPNFSRSVTVTAGERLAVEVVFGAVEEPADVPTEQPPVEDTQSSRRRLSQAWFWGSLGLAVALGIGGTVTGALVLSTGEEYDDLLGRCVAGDADACSQGPDTRSTGETLRTTTNVLLPAAGVFAAVALVLVFFTDFGGGEEDSASRFQLTAGAGDLGLGARVSF